MMSTMDTATVISMDRRRERVRRMELAIHVRRGLEGDRRRRSRPGGRAWLNGQRLGEPDGLGYLGEVHD